MNERIEEIAHEQGIPWDNKYHWYVSNTDLKRFGELIVKECADYFGREGDHRFEVDGNWIAKTIKQHFGVE